MCSAEQEQDALVPETVSIGEISLAELTTIETLLILYGGGDPIATVLRARLTAQIEELKEAYGGAALTEVQDRQLEAAGAMNATEALQTLAGLIS